MIINSPSHLDNISKPGPDRINEDLKLGQVSEVAWMTHWGELGPGQDKN